MSARRTARVLLGLTIALSGPAAFARTIDYEVRRQEVPKRYLERFKRIARVTLDDLRGWSLRGNIVYRRAADGEFKLILASPAVIDRASSVCSPQWSCRVGDRVLINLTRWRRGTPTWTKGLRSYRSYVINHEVGHWLGLGHATCPGSGRRAPVMMQQSKGLGDCRANVWPLRGELRRVAGIHGVRRWPLPAADAPCSIVGTNEDDVLEGTRGTDVICGKDGHDRILARSGHDVLRGGPGRDVVFAGAGADLIHGHSAGDELNGERGSDKLVAGPGIDILDGGPRRDACRYADIDIARRCETKRWEALDDSNFSSAAKLGRGSAAVAE